MTLAEYTARREALLEQLAQPDTVTFQDRSVRNRSPKEIQAAIQSLDQAYTASIATTTAKRIGRMYMSGEGK